MAAVKAAQRLVLLGGGHAQLAVLQALARQPSRLLLLPAPVFMRWSDHEPFRRHVFALFAARMADLIALTE
ncbi:hypothetical protein HZU83_22450, partial [Sphaerotilus montanus]|nr:hypothetical protein [Sphaerotilus montanus]